MNKFFGNTVIPFLIILCLSALFSALVLKTLYPLHFSAQPLLFTDLIGIPFSLPVGIIYLSSILILFLIWSIGKIFFKGRKVYLPVLLMGISPWFVYLTALGSFYIYLLCLLLINILAIFFIKNERDKKYHIIFVFSAVLLLYSSLQTFIIYPFLISAVIVTKVINFDKIKINLLIILIAFLPLILLMIKNPAGIKNIYNNQIGFLSDSAILDTVNNYQGESKREGFKYLSKVSENKYIYTSKVLILKLIKHIMPSTFFTPQEKLLAFSFQPPIYFGFLFPFLFGLYSIKSGYARKSLILSLMLIMPSFFSQRMIDLNRLMLLLPVIIFIISFGLFKLIDSKKRPIKLILYACIILVMVQFIVTIFDLSLREYPRYERFYGFSNWQIRN